ncbi:MAG: tetratricopeptide repeat protein [Candidatus Omnitrophica bacterium]|nr:tetratricopeptide repeat protein [Candidatus Omnitrophota bacterium]
MDMADGDRYFEQSDFLKSIEVYETLLKENQDNYEILWRLSRSYSKQGNIMKKKKEIKEYYKRSYEYAERAVKSNENGVDGVIYLAESAGKLSKVENAEEKVRLSKVIKDSAEKAIKLDSNNFKPYFILGVWHLNVSTAGWLEKQFAEAFLGGLQDSSLEEAEKNLKKSIELDPDFIESYYQLALLYKETDNEELAIENLEKALRCTVDTAKKEEIKEKSEKLLKKLKR